MKRRNFIAGLGGAAVSPMIARAQQVALPVVGLLSISSAAAFAQRLRAFHQGLGEAGFIENKNVTIEYRWADGQYDRLPALASELVQRPVTMIAAISDSAARAAKGATPSIPIVFTGGSDPVKQGLIASLSRPGGNLTGIVNLNVELGAKRLQVLHEAVPQATVMALLINPTGANAHSVVRDTQAAATGIGLLSLHILRASTTDEINAAFASLSTLRAGALLIGADAFFINQSEQLAALTVRHRIPAIFQFREFPMAGGLMSYGGSAIDLTRQVGVYAGRVLKGEKPADLPVQQSTKAELIINLKTAKTLGLSVPLSLLARADEVIE